MGYFVFEIIDDAFDRAGLAGLSAVCDEHAGVCETLGDGGDGGVGEGDGGRLAEDGGGGEEEGRDDDPVVAERGHGWGQRRRRRRKTWLYRISGLPGLVSFNLEEHICCCLSFQSVAFPCIFYDERYRRRGLNLAAQSSSASSLFDDPSIHAYLISFSSLDSNLG